MSAQEPWRIILVSEGPSDERRIPHLIDHFLASHHASTCLDDVRRYEGLGGQSFIRTKDIPVLVRERNLDRRYSSDGPRKGDAGSFRKLFQVLQKEKLLGPRTVVVWSRDDDGDDDRRTDVENALKDLPVLGTWLLAIARECGEAWVIAGFSPKTKAEIATLKDLRQQLGFAPLKHPKFLSHKENVPTSAKTVVEKLFEGDHPREHEALVAATRSDHPAAIPCGLRRFCDQVETWLTS